MKKNERGRVVDTAVPLTYLKITYYLAVSWLKERSMKKTVLKLGNQSYSREIPL